MVCFGPHCSCRDTVAIRMAPVVQCHLTCTQTFEQVKSKLDTVVIYIYIDGLKV